MEHVYNQIVSAFGDRAEVHALLRRLDTHHGHRMTNKVYAFLCQQQGIIKTLYGIENHDQREWLLNLYRGNLRDHTPTSFPQDLTDRCVSILHARLRGVL